MSDDHKRPRGRPAITAGEASVNLHLRLATIDYDRINAICPEDGVSIAAVARATVRLATKRQHEP